MDLPPTTTPPVRRPVAIAYPGINPDFRTARESCRDACAAFNNTSENAPPEERVARWLDIVQPSRPQQDEVNGTQVKDTPLTFDKAVSAGAKPAAPFVLRPLYMDYGLRVKVAPSTFINRGCTILDTPVADVTIGNNVLIGPQALLISVSHALQPEERNEMRELGMDSEGSPITICDGVWIGGRVTILGGVTIGEGSVIAAGSLVTRNIPAHCLAMGSPARVVRDFDDKEPALGDRIRARVFTLEEALALEDN